MVFQHYLPPPVAVAAAAEWFKLCMKVGRKKQKDKKIYIYIIYIYIYIHMQCNALHVPSVEVHLYLCLQAGGPL
jgi:hypothetical protein